MEKIKLFVVHEEKNNLDPTVFSTAERAEAYIHRFPDMGDDSYRIVECELDPKFVTFPDRSPYFAWFNADRTLGLRAWPTSEEDALEEKAGAFNDGAMEFFFLAENRLAAVVKAYEMREQSFQEARELMLQLKK